jgi:hypothetical protein
MRATAAIGGRRNPVAKERRGMGQIITVVSILARVRLLGRDYVDRLVTWWSGGRSSNVVHTATDGQEFERPIYKASAHEFLHGAADLTFGLLILGLAFFMLMWVIATG